MEEADMYESLPTTTTATTHMMAGAAAGLMEHCIMYPVDCVKTRMQSLVPDPRADYRNVPDALYRIVRHEGLKQTIRGINAVVCGAGPAHAMYFACYEKMKRTLSGGQQGHHLANGTAGCVATLLHDAFMNPADVIKQRMQMFGSPYRTCYECATTVYREEGVRAFYRSFTTQLSMNIPFQCIHFMVYELTQDFCNHSRQYNPKTHVLSGAMAGAVAAFVTMPLDVCKTLLNTQEQCARTQVAYISGIKAAVRTIHEFQGIPGFFRGVSARILYQMPATAISWSVYEFFKYFLTSKHKHSADDGYLSATSVKSIPIHHASSR